MRIKLIDDWRKGRKFSSVWVAAIGAFLGGIGALMSGVSDIWPWLHVWVNTMPRWMIWAGGAAFAVLFIIARFTLFASAPKPFYDHRKAERKRDGALGARRLPYG